MLLSHHAGLTVRRISPDSRTWAPHAGVGSLGYRGASPRRHAPGKPGIRARSRPVTADKSDMPDFTRRCCGLAAPPGRQISMTTKKNLPLRTIFLRDHETSAGRLG
jgi:hypothetical protein